MNHPPNDAHKLQRFFGRWAQRGQIRSCCEASRAGCVLYRQITEWGWAWLRRLLREGGLEPGGPVVFGE